MTKSPGSIFFFAPFVSSTMRVEIGWIDYNGHLGMAFYHHIFDRAAEEAFGIAGLGPDYLEQRKASFFTAETHCRYLRELVAGDTVRVTVQLLGFDEKRIHFHMEMRHAVDGWASATCETLALHVDAVSRKTTPFPADILSNLAVMKASHAKLTKPASAGRGISLSRHSGHREPVMQGGTRH
jgi:acyl-CoA thioester hydrolase